MPEQIDEERSHPEIVSDLLDLQARLRGEPASLVRSKMGRPGDETAIATLERPDVETEPAGSRIDTLRRRLASLELEIEAYERAVAALPPTPRSAGVVLPFRRPVDEPTLP
ncbi:MAG TPA: hypothetical protein VLE71_02055 [Actinomycetota bacterium]|nr:hypothetical protein [Actinomycetota bacterium]